MLALTLRFYNSLCKTLFCILDSTIQHVHTRFYDPRHSFPVKKKSVYTHNIDIQPNLSEQSKQIHIIKKNSHSLTASERT